MRVLEAAYVFGAFQHPNGKQGAGLLDPEKNNQMSWSLPTALNSRIEIGMALDFHSSRSQEVQSERVPGLLSGLSGLAIQSLCGSSGPFLCLAAKTICRSLSSC